MRSAHAHRRWFPVVRALILVSLLVPFTGCAYIGAAIVVLASGGGGGGGGKKTNEAPAVSFTGSIPTQATDSVTTVPYRLFDNNGHRVDLVIEFSTDGGSTFALATEGPGSDGLLGLTASEVGELHTFVWDFLFDVPDALTTSRQAVLQFTATDEKGKAGAPELSPPFRFGNTAPLVLLDPIVASPTDTTVVVGFTLADDYSDPLDVSVEFTQDGFVSTLTATPLAGSTTCPDGVTGLVSDPTGVAHCFEWDFPMDILGASDTVQVRVVATDSALAPSTAAESQAFRIGNDAPIAVLQPVDPLVSVSLDFVLLDSTSDVADIALEYSQDGAAFVPAGSVFGSLSGLATAPGGRPHNLAWNSLADVGLVNGIFRLRLTPSDPFATGAPAETPAFPLQNTPQPYAFVDLPLADDIVSGQVQVEHRLVDFTGDPVDITVEVRPDPFSLFQPATEAVGPPSEGTMGLLSALTGVTHIYVWDSNADFPGLDLTEAEIRLTPSDASGVGRAALRAPLRLNNNSEPSLQIAMNPLSPSTQRIPIPYDLLDVESDPTDVVVQFSTDGGTTFSNGAAEASGSDGTRDLSSSPAGTAHVFIWDSVADLGLVRETAVVLRLTPIDHPDPDLGTGAFDTTATFIVDNTAQGAPPTLSSINPKRGPEAGGNTVILSGTGFVAGTMATIGGQALVSQSRVSDVTIVGQVPPSLAGPGAADVSVTNSRGTAILPGAYRYTQPPSVTIDPALDGTTVGGNVAIDYTLFDADSQKATVIVEYSLDSGATYTPAAQGPGSDGISGLTTSPGGVAHVYVWNTLIDGVAISGPEPNCRVRITPADSEPGVPDVSGIFTVVNGTAPSAVIDPAIDGSLQAGNVTVSYTLLDVDSDPATISVEFSTDSGLSFFTATPGPGGDGLTGLATSPVGVPHTYVWNSLADAVGLAGPVPGVRVRITPSDVQVGTADESGDFTVNNNQPPSAQIDPAINGSTQGGDVLVSYTLLDAESDPVSVVVEYSTDSGTTFFPASEGAGGDGSTGLATSPGGTLHVWSWNSVLDGVALVCPAPAVRVRITPSDSQTGGADESGNFTVMNNGAPAATVDPAIDGSTRSGNVLVSYTLVDPESDAASILVEFSPDSGTTYFPATQGAGGEGTTGLATSPGGTMHVFSWNSSLDGLGLVCDDTMVRVRITPADCIAGAGDESGDFTVDNNQPVTAAVDPAIDGTTRSGNVLVSYTLTDPDSDAIAITADFSTDAGATWAAATEGAGGDGTSGLTSSPGGTAHVFSWDSVANGIAPICDETMVQVRISPSDCVPGTPDASGSFTVDNNLPVVATVDPAIDGSMQSGNVTVSYDLADPESDTASIVVEYSTDAGSTWAPATEGAGSDGTSGLATSPVGTAHVFVWETVTDGVALVCPEATTRVRITPSDCATSAFDSSGDFTVTNNVPPTATVDPAIDGTMQSGDVLVSYDLADVESDTASIVAEYTTDSGNTWFPATQGAGGDGTSGLTTTPGGTTHIYSWDSVADGVALVCPETAVRMRITPSDCAAGVAGQSGDFTVINNTAPTAAVDPGLDGTTQTGDVTVTYTLTDPDSDLATILPEFSTDSGGTWAPTTAGVGGDGTSGLTTSPGGTMHTYVWDSLADAIGLLSPQAGCRVRITPSDCQLGVADETGDFTVDNVSNDLALVVNNLENTVSLVDAGTGVELDTDGNGANGITPIPVGMDPRGVAISPKADFAAVAAAGTDDVTIIDLSDYSTPFIVAVGADPVHLTFDGDGSRIFVLNDLDDTVDVIDVATGLRIDTDAVAPGTNPIPGITNGTFIEMSPGGDLVYAGPSHVIDATSYAVLHTIPTDLSANFAVLPDGKHIYTSGAGTTNAVGVLRTDVLRDLDLDSDLSTTTAGSTAGLSRILVGVFPEGISAFGTKAYVINRTDRTVSIIDSTTHTVSNTVAIPAAGTPVDVGQNRNGTLGLVSNFDNDLVDIIDLTTETFTGTIPVGAGPTYLAFIPKSRPAVTPILHRSEPDFARASDTIVLEGLGFDPVPANNTVTIDGLAATVLASTATTIDVEVPAGATLGDILVTVAGETSNPRRFTPVTMPLLYVASADPDGVVVYDSDLARSEPVGFIPLAPGADPIGLAIHPDGSRLYTANSGTGDVSVIDLNNHQVVTSVATGNNPRWVAASPDGTVVLVYNVDDDDVDLIDTGTNTVTGTVPGVTADTGLHVDSAGVRAYAGGLQVIDIAGRLLLDPLNIPNSAIQDRTALIPGDAYAWRTRPADDEISLVDLRMRKEVDTDDNGTTGDGSGGAPFGVTRYLAQVDPGDLAVTKDRAFVANTTPSPTLSVYDIPTGVELDTDAAGGVNPVALNGTGVAEVAIDGPGDRIYVSMNGSDRLVLVEHNVPMGTYDWVGDFVCGTGPRGIVLGKPTTTEPTTPIVQRISAGFSRVGGTITIDGIGFGAVQGVNDKVFVNGVEATVTFWSDTQIVITVPSTASGDIVVDLNGMMSNPVFLRVSTGPFAYVTCEDADVVGVIDMGTLERAGAIDVSNSPVGLVIHPDGSRLYVGRSAPDEITMIDLDTHEATDLGIPGLDGPRELAIHPDGDFLFAMNRPQNEISVIETVTHTEIDTDFNGANGLTRITGITADEDMDVNPEGTILVAGGYHIVDVDPDSAPQPGGTRYTVLGTFTTLPFSTFDRFIFLDDGEDAWRTDRSQSPPMPDDPIETVDVMKMFLWQGIDLDQNVTTTSPNAPTGITRVITREGPWGLAVSGDAVWVGNTDHDSISEIDGVTRTELAVHPVEADFPWDLDVDRAGATLAIIGRNDDTVTIWDIATTSSLGDFSVGDLPTQIVIAPATTAEPIPPRLADLDTRIGAPGDVINLRGARFDPTPANNLVHFAGAPPVVPSAGDATMLTVTVPVGATTGPVQVEDTISGLFSNRIRFHVPAGTLAYVAGGVRRDGVLVVDLDPAVREVIGFIPTGANPGPDPRRVAVVPAGAAKEDDIWVTNWADDTVTIIDGLTHLVVGDLAAGPAPEDIAMTPSGAFAYLVSTMDDTVRKFDTDLRNDTGITIGAIPDDFDLAMDPTALWLYAGGNQRIDITTDLKVGPDTGIVGPCEFENTGAKAYITIGGMNEVAIWDVALLMEAGPRIPIAGGGPQQIAADPTLDQVYVVNTLLDSVSMIDTISDVEIDADGPGLADRIVPGSTLLSFVTADANSIVYILAGGEGVMSLVDASVVPVTKIADITVGDGAQAVAIGN